MAKYGSISATGSADGQLHPHHCEDDDDIDAHSKPTSSKPYQSQTSNTSSVDVDGLVDRVPRRSSIAQSLRNSIGDGLSLAGSVSSSVRDLIVNHGLSQRSGRSVSLRQLGGQSTITRSSFTLIKNLVGAGVLALPSGVAAFADSKTAVVAASFWLVIMGIIFGYEFQLIAKVCDMTLAATFREAWDDSVGRSHNEIVSKHFGLIVSWVNALKPFLGNLAYSMILADTFRSLFAAFGWDVARTTSLLIVTILGIVPLCLMKNLDGLAPFSILGTLSIGVIAFCMGLRCFDGTYHPQTGIYIDDLPQDLQPLFGTYNGCWTAAVLVYVVSTVLHMMFSRFIIKNLTYFHINRVDNVLYRP
jgi:Transmembrane amino acid transporter protein